jgi:hypothetical protein
MPGSNADFSLHRIRQNTVVEKKSVTVHYPHHPYYGRTLPVVEIHRNGDPPGYICKISEYGTLFIPKWMSHPEVARGCAIVPTAQISFETLLKVAEYLNGRDDVS